MQQITPLFDRVLIEKIEQPEMVGLIIVPDAAKPAPQLCLVVEVGSGRNIDAPGAYEIEVAGDRYVVVVHRPLMHVQKGDKVLIGKFSGSDVELLGKTLTIVREDEILAIVRDVDEAEAPLPPSNVDGHTIIRDLSVPPAEDPAA